MTFTPYTSMREQLDPSICRKLDALETQFGQLELKQINEKKFCLRIYVKVKDEVTPIASIGRSIEAAAERLERLTKTVIQSD